MSSKYFRVLVTLIVLALCATSRPGACIKCFGTGCVIDAWNGALTCKTDLGNAACITMGFCGGSIPPVSPPKPKPIDVIVMSIFSLDTQSFQGFPATMPANGIGEVKAAIAARAGLSVDGVHLRSSNLTIGYDVAGAPDEATGLGASGHLFSAVQSTDGQAHIRECFYATASGPMVVSAEADVAPGSALLSTVQLAGQTMVVALHYTNYSEAEFAANGAAIQAAIRSDVLQHREYPSFAMVATQAPGPCGN